MQYRGKYDMSKVSVIMPVYNAEKYLGEAIASVLRQTYADFELLLVYPLNKQHGLDKVKYALVKYRLEGIVLRFGPLFLKLARGE